MKWQRSLEEEGEEEETVVEIGPEPTEAAAKQEAADLTEVRVRTGPPKGVPDTPLTPQRAAVTATTFTETKLGTAWLPSPVPGSQSVQRDHEGQTSLTRRKLIMTSCFPASIL